MRGWRSSHPLEAPEERRRPAPASWDTPARPVKTGADSARSNDRALSISPDRRESSRRRPRDRDARKIVETTALAGRRTTFFQLVFGNDSMPSLQSDRHLHASEMRTQASMWPGTEPQVRSIATVEIYCDRIGEHPWVAIRRTQRQPNHLALHHRDTMEAKVLGYLATFTGNYAVDAQDLLHRRTGEREILTKLLLICSMCGEVLERVAELAPSGVEPSEHEGRADGLQVDVGKRLVVNPSFQQERNEIGGGVRGLSLTGSDEIPEVLAHAAEEAG